MKTANALSDQVKETSAGMLNSLLAESIDLYLQARQYHWNIRGPQFLTLHGLFGDLYELLADQADELAERIAQLGETAEGSLFQVGSASDVTEPIKSSVGLEMAEDMAGKLANYSKRLVKWFSTETELGDHGSADMLIGMAREIDKKVWMLESFLM